MKTEFYSQLFDITGFIEFTLPSYEIYHQIALDLSLHKLGMIRFEILCSPFRSLAKIRTETISNRPFSYSTKEPGSSDIFIHFYAIEARLNGVRASIAIDL